jgi:prepilin-type N-terminal cleavage/methylation domain-containing protein
MNKTHRKKLLDTKNGFTLVEVLVVIFIMGFLITATAVSYSRVWLNNQIDTAETELRNMSGAFSSYMIDYGNITVGNDINYETVIGEVVEVLKQTISFL